MLLSGWIHLAARRRAGQRVVVAVRARATDVVDDPPQEATGWHGFEGAPGKGSGDVVGGGLFDALGLPLPVGGAQPLGHLASLLVADIVEGPLETAPEWADDGGSQLVDHVVELGQRAVGRRTRAPRGREGGPGPGRLFEVGAAGGGKTGQLLALR